MECGGEWGRYPCRQWFLGPHGAGLGCDFVRDGSTMAGIIHLEPPDHAVILFRVENNAVNKLRSVSPDCEITSVMVLR